MPGGGDTVTIIYPQGCKEVTEDLTPDELIRRLKVFNHYKQIIRCHLFLTHSIICRH